MLSYKLESANGPVLTLRDAAQYVGMSEGTLRLKAISGVVPGFKPHHDWRFRRSALDAWMETLEREQTEQRRSMGKAR